MLKTYVAKAVDTRLYIGSHDGRWFYRWADRKFFTSLLPAHGIPCLE